MASVLEGVRDLLVAGGVGTFGATTGWSIHIGRMVDRPDTAVVIYPSGGQPANPKWLLDFPSVMVQVRGNANDYASAFAKAEAVKSTLLGLPSQDLNGDRWVAINLAGDINPLGHDDSQRPLFSLNFRLIIEPASGINRQPL